MPVIPIIAGLAAVSGGITALGVAGGIAAGFTMGTVLAGATIVGGAMMVVGGITGSKKLQKYGGYLALAGSLGSAAVQQSAASKIATSKVAQASSAITNTGGTSVAPSAISAPVSAAPASNAIGGGVSSGVATPAASSATPLLSTPLSATPAAKLSSTALVNNSNATINALGKGVSQSVQKTVASVTQPGIATTLGRYAAATASFLKDNQALIGTAATAYSGIQGAKAKKEAVALQVQADQHTFNTQQSNINGGSVAAGVTTRNGKQYNRYGMLMNPAPGVNASIVPAI